MLLLTGGLAGLLFSRSKLSCDLRSPLVLLANIIITA